MSRRWARTRDWLTSRAGFRSAETDRSSPSSWRHQGQERILRQLGLEARAPPRVPARGDLQQAA